MITIRHILIFVCSNVSSTRTMSVRVNYSQNAKERFDIIGDHLLYVQLYYCLRVRFDLQDKRKTIIINNLLCIINNSERQEFPEKGLPIIDSITAIVVTTRPTLLLYIYATHKICNMFYLTLRDRFRL